jgi:peptide/nickel transport system substrate-binding protein
MNDARRDHGLTRRAVVRGGVAGGALLTSGALLAACGGSHDAPTSAGSPASAPRRGGTLRVGVIGGGSSESVDAQVYYGGIDGTRLYQLYDPLAYFSRDGTKVDLWLAESIESNARGDEWTIRVKDGIEFHNGKTVGADDVRHTFDRIKASTAGGSQLFKRKIIESSYREMDERTLRFKLNEPDVFLRETLADYTARIVPVGYDPEKPVGCGPFKYQSFTKGKQSVFTRFENYWQEGKPYLDEVQILSFEDDVALVNALLSGQLDVIEGLPLSQTRQIEANPDFTLIRTERPIQWVPIVMRVDAAPYSDVRVRQALRLLVDRPQMVQQVLGGEGEIANDYLFALPTYGDPGLPQRELDVEQAKSLLKAAGQENLSAELVTAPFVPEAVPTAEVFAQQAKAAGINITVRKLDTGSFYGDQFLKRTLTSDYWGAQPYALQADTLLISPPGQPFNETSWSDEDWLKLMRQVYATTDVAKQTELVHECMRIESERGGYLNWGAAYGFDAANKRVQGLHADAIDPLGSHDLREAFLTS